MRLIPHTLLLLIVLFSASCAGLQPRRNNTGHPGQAGRSVASQTGQTDINQEAPLNRSDYETLDPVLTQPPTRRPAGSITLSGPERQAMHSESAIKYAHGPLAEQLIEEELVFLTRDVKDKVASWLKRSEKYLPHAKQVFRENGLPEDLAYLAYIESGYNPEALSRSGAAGVWQFMPFTGKKYGLRIDWWIDERRDPYKAAQSAAAYLRFLYQTFGDWSLAIAAYNAGEGKIGRAIAQTGSRDFFDLYKRNATVDERNQLKAETLNYVPRFFAMVKVVKNHVQLGYEPINLHRGLELREVAVSGGTDLRGLARAVGQDWNSFVELNPAFRRDAVPPSESAVAYVPPAQVAQAARFLSSPASRQAAASVHMAQRGDTWGSLAAKSNVSVDALKQINKQSSDTLKPGQKVTLPGRALAAVNSSETSAGRAAASQVRQQTMPVVYADASHTVKKGKKGVECIVQNGDTLYSIARRHNVDLEDLMRANGVQSQREVYVGRLMTIPAPASASANSAAPRASRSRDRIAESPNDSKRPSAVGKRSAHYIIRRGDTVASIAQQFAVTPQDIIGWNKLEKGQKLQPGNQIAILVD
jgi:membrane-bound lytic murein transglycosylase D